MKYNGSSIVLGIVSLDPTWSTADKYLEWAEGYLSNLKKYYSYGLDKGLVEKGSFYNRLILLLSGSFITEECVFSDTVDLGILSDAFAMACEYLSGTDYSLFCKGFRVLVIDLLTLEGGVLLNGLEFSKPVRAYYSFYVFLLGVCLSEIRSCFTISSKLCKNVEGLDYINYLKNVKAYTNEDQNDGIGEIYKIFDMARENLPEVSYTNFTEGVNRLINELLKDEKASQEGV